MPQPLSPTALAARIAEVAASAAAVAGQRGYGLRLGVEGPVADDAAALADDVAAELADRAVPVARVRGEEFLRARSLRLEHGPADPDALRKASERSLEFAADNTFEKTFRRRIDHLDQVAGSYRERVRAR